MNRAVCVARLIARRDAYDSGRVWHLDTCSPSVHLLHPTSSSLHPSSPVDSMAPSLSPASPGTAAAGSSMLPNRHHSPECQNYNQHFTAFIINYIKYDQRDNVITGERWKRWRLTVSAGPVIVLSRIQRTSCCCCLTKGWTAKYNNTLWVLIAPTDTPCYLWTTAE